MDDKFTSSYVPLDIAASVNEWSEGVQGGEGCGVEQLKDVFAWMRGSINGWFGWANDGKSQMRDFLKVIKAKNSKWKFCLFRPEDMDAVMVDGHPQIKANRIYKNLAWCLTGKTWSKNFAKKYFLTQMTLEEEMEALDFVQDHFFVVYPKDRRYHNHLDECKFIYEKYGVSVFEIDTFSGLLVPGEKGERDDEKMSRCFFDYKELALQTNTVVDFVAHAKSQNDVKEKDGRFKVVNQFMILGGSAWDAKMDGQYSIYRPERHLNPADPKVHFWNLKQKNSQIVGVQRGSYEKIEFAYTKMQYYFDGINPLTGENKNPPKQAPVDFTEPKAYDDRRNDPNYLPF